MAWVVTEPCIKCKFTDCVEVCPVDCFREGENMLVIDPDECISCGACEPVCPVKAIVSEDDIPDQYREYIDLNRDLARGWPVIDRRKEPLPTSKEFENVLPKKQLLSRNPAK